MYHSYHHFPTTKYAYPAKQLRQPPMAHRGIQCESCDTLYEEGKKGEEINEACQGIVSYTQVLFAFHHQDINFDHLPHFFPKMIRSGDELLPVGILVSGKSPINSEKEIEEEQIGSYKVYEPEPAHGIAETCFPAA
jgi:hypothetical protein